MPTAPRRRRGKEKPKTGETREAIVRSFFQNLASGRCGTWLKRAAAIGTVVGAIKYNREISVGVSNLAWDSAVSVGLRHERLPTRVEGFEAAGYRSEHISQALLLMFGQEDVERNVAVFRFTTEHIPMPATYSRGGNEGGHCTQSAGRRPSEAVLTIDGLRPDTTINQFLDILTHEIAGHAILDLENAYEIPHEHEIAIDEALDRVSGEDSIYAYVNGYHDYAVIVSQQETRKAEFIAELAREVSSFAEDAGPGTEQLDWRAKTKLQLARAHPTASEETIESVMRVVDAVANWKGGYGYWERMQAGRREAYALLERNQNETRTTQEREGYLRRYREGIAANPDMSFKTTLMRAFEARPEQLPPAYRLLQRNPLLIARRYNHHDPEFSQQQELVEVIHDLQQERDRELQRLARTIHDPGLRHVFLVYAPMFVTRLEMARPSLTEVGSYRIDSIIDVNIQNALDVDYQVRQQRHRTVQTIESFYHALSSYIALATLGEGLDAQVNQERIRSAEQWLRQDEAVHGTSLQRPHHHSRRRREH